MRMVHSNINNNDSNAHAPAAVSYSSAGAIVEVHRSRDTITNPKSTTVKKIQALLSTNRKKRMQYQQVIVEGPRMIRDLFKSSSSSRWIQQIVVDVNQADYYYSSIFAASSTLLSSGSDESSASQQESAVESRKSSSESVSTSSSVVSDDMNAHNSKEDDTATTTTALTSDDSSSSTPPHRILWTMATPEILSACTDTVHNQGILAICTIPNWSSPSSIIQSNSNPTQQSTIDTTGVGFQPPSSFNVDNNNNNPSSYPFILVLDGLSDPGNVGTLIRSAVACGVTAIYLLHDCCDVWNPKAIRAAMGTTFVIPIYTTTSWSDCYHQLREVHGCTPSTIYAATMLDDDDDECIEPSDDERESRSSGSNQLRRRSVSHYEVDWCKAAMNSASALILGQEGNGLSVNVRNDVATGRISAVHVPMQPTSVESLNAAVCGSVIMFEYYRQKTMQLTATAAIATSPHLDVT